jgi:glycopeptide antibiotics resistance protein
MHLQETWTANPKAYHAANKLTIILFAIYLIALCWILLLKLGVRFHYMGNRNVNLIPFNGRSVLTGENIMNAVIFVPLGIYAGVLFKRWSFTKQFFFFLLASLIIEGLQFLLAVGAFDVTDIITNTSGGLIGLLTYKGIEKVFRSSVKAQRIINIVAALGTALMIALLLLLKMDMLPVRYR